MTKRQTIGVGVVALVAALLGGVVSQALASVSFSDISGSPFEEEIINIANAGIATGFPDGTFRPHDAVNRQQFAAWMNRGGGRVASDRITFGPISGSDSPLVLSGADMTAGAVGGAGGFVMVTANFAFTSSSPATCPCRIDIDLFSGAGNVIIEGGLTATAVSFVLPGPGADGGQSSMTQSLTRVFRLPANTTDDYRAGFDVLDANAVNINGAVRITALYVPFSGSGGSS
jgi:S-layer homology domain